jgi:hypothetical protein
VIVMSDATPTHDEQPPQDHTPRRGGRLLQESLTCSLGVVVDMSVTGAKIRCRLGSRPAEGKKAIVEMSTDSGDVRLQARVVWTRLCGILRWEAGVEFVDVTDEDTRKLTEIAHSYYDRMANFRAA